MILSVWKPVFLKKNLHRYEMVDIQRIINKIGTSNYKVIWLCDNPECKTPSLKHSINNCHLKKTKMCYDLQICRPCQCTGDGNGRFGDNRTWDELHTKEKVYKLKKNMSDKWIGVNNPSKSDDVKKKKNQPIINIEYIKKIVLEKNFTLLDIIKIDGKRSEFYVECCKGHKNKKIYLNFTRKTNKYICQNCYYESLSLVLTDEEIKQFERYSKKVRALSNKTYKKHKDFINPLNLPIGKTQYHIDHKYSIYQGFKDNVSPNILSLKENLEILYYIDNLSKNYKCSISLDELIKKTNYL